MTILDIFDVFGIAVIIATAVLFILSLKASKENEYRFQKYSMILFAVYAIPCSLDICRDFWGLVCGVMICFSYFGIARLVNPSFLIRPK